MTDHRFDPLFDELETIVLADERLSILDTSKPDWIGQGAPGDDYVGTLPCIRITGIASTNSLSENEFTAVLTVFTKAGDTDATTALALALEAGINPHFTIHCMGWVVRNDEHFNRAVFPIRFYL